MAFIIGLRTKALQWEHPVDVTLLPIAGGGRFQSWCNGDGEASPDAIPLRQITALGHVAESQRSPVRSQVNFTQPEQTRMMTCTGDNEPAIFFRAPQKSCNHNALRRVAQVDRDEDGIDGLGRVWIRPRIKNMPPATLHATRASRLGYSAKVTVRL